jgi:hypothetical protein
VVTARALRFPELVPLLVAAAIPVAAVVVVGGVLACLPLIALMLPLLFGRYPAVETLVRRASRARARPRRKRPARSARPGRARSAVPRGGSLIAASLAERAPPTAPSLA